MVSRSSCDIRRITWAAWWAGRILGGLGLGVAGLGLMGPWIAHVVSPVWEVA